MNFRRKKSTKSLIPIFEVDGTRKAVNALLKKVRRRRKTSLLNLRNPLNLRKVVVTTQANFRCPSLSYDLADSPNF